MQSLQVRIGHFHQFRLEVVQVLQRVRLFLLYTFDGLVLYFLDLPSIVLDLQCELLIEPPEIDLEVIVVDPLVIVQRLLMRHPRTLLHADLRQVVAGFASRELLDAVHALLHVLVVLDLNHVPVVLFLHIYYTTNMETLQIWRFTKELEKRNWRNERTLSWGGSVWRLTLAIASSGLSIRGRWAAASVQTPRDMRINPCL